MDTVKPGHEIRHCKLASCPNECDPDAPTRGLWANMCTPCRRGETPQGVVYREQRQGVAGIKDTPGDPPAPGAPAGSLEAKAKKLVPHARRLEAKVRAHKAAKTGAAAAVKDFSAALAEIRDAAQAILGQST